MVLQRQIADHLAAAPAPGADVLAKAFGSTFWWVLGFVAVAVLPALLLPGFRGSPATSDSEPPATSG